MTVLFTQLAVPAADKAAEAVGRLAELRAATGDQDLAAKYAGAEWVLRTLPLLDRLEELAGEADALAAELLPAEEDPRYPLAAPGPVADLRRVVDEAQAFARRRAWQALRMGGVR